MKLMPASTATFMMSNDVFSSQPTSCMNDSASASPNVIAPRQSVETFTPVDPSVRVSMPAGIPRGGRSREAGQVGKRAAGEQADVLDHTIVALDHSDPIRRL